MPAIPNTHAIFVLLLTVFALYLFTRDRLPLEASGLTILITLILVFQLYPYQGADGVRLDAYAAYRPAGGGWGASIQINDIDSGGHNPVIAVDPSGNARVLWIDWRDGNNIYSAYRPAGGSWGANVKVNDSTGEVDNIYPSIAADANGHFYAVWEDWRNGNPDIYSDVHPEGAAWGVD